MKKAISLLALSACASLFSGCAMGVSPVTGVIFTEVSGPLTATTGAAARTGTASCQSFLGAVALGDCSVDAAKKNGGITTVASVDYKTRSILGFYAEVTTIVRGK